jgi:cobalt-zinc-cadmium efflux system membrane fusion protein
MSPLVHPAASRAFAVAAVLLAGCARHDASEGDTASATPTVKVAVATVESRPFEASVEAPGQWRSTGEIVVAAPFAAYVESLTVGVGDGVARGAVLGTLVTRDSRAAVLGATQLLAQARDEHARAEATRALAEARHDLVRVRLLASAAGTIVRRAVAPGAELAESGELLAIVPASSLVFEAHVPAADAGRVAPGQPAEIAVEGGAAIAATVQRRLPQAGAADQSALVWLAPSRAPGAGLLERFGTARIELGGAHRASAVPEAALVEDDLSGEVRVACVGPGGIATWHAIQVGLSANGWREVRVPALAAGTRVIVRGQRGLPDSTHVQIVP